MRFLQRPTAGINALAFSHPKVETVALSRTKKVLGDLIQARLAIGRSNGDIEVWNPNDGAWHQETVIYGARDRSIDALVWLTESDTFTPAGDFIPGRSRLYSTGYTSTVTEWDLENRRAKTHATGGHGDIWCIAAQPPRLDLHDAAAANRSRKLVVGTSDGTIALYTTEEGELRFERILARTPHNRIKIVCVAFQRWDVGIFGCSDSAMRAYNIRTGKLLRHMTLGADLEGGSKEVIVWDVKCLASGDIVSADSTGQVCIWDGKTRSQLQRIQSHKQDVLSLAVSADGSTIFSGGMDRRTAVYQRGDQKDGRWARIWHRRYHHHDVKMMASFENENMSVVVSGGELDRSSAKTNAPAVLTLST